MSTVKTILVAVADPRRSSKRRLEVEVREISVGLNTGQKREQFQLKKIWAVSPNTLRRAILEHHPSVVHFCGYSTDSHGIELEHSQGGVHLVDTDALSRFFKLFSDIIECVVLSACYSELQAQAISDHIDFVIGMNNSISHEAATQFSIGFYDSLSAGSSYEKAFEFGQNAIELHNLPERLTPVIRRKRLTQESSQHKSSVLIVDDDELWLARHERRLKAVGIECQSTQLAEEAIRIAKIDSSVKFALIDEILFVPPSGNDNQHKQLQRWQGSGIIREIAPVRPDIQFIVVTSAPEQRSQGSSQKFRQEVLKLRSLPGVIDVFHQQDIQDNPESVYKKLTDLLRLKTQPLKGRGSTWGQLG